MKTLRVTSDFYNWFQTGIEAVTTIDNREYLHIEINERIPGKHLDYPSIIAVIEKFRTTFSWLEIKEIRLEWCQEIAKADKQFYKGGDYTPWRNEVLRDFSSVTPVKDYEHEDMSNIYYNYPVEVDGKIHPLYYGSTDAVLIFLYYDEGLDNTLSTVLFEVRKNLFEVDDFDVNLPEEYLKHNSELLRSSVEELKTQIVLI